MEEQTAQKDERLIRVSPLKVFLNRPEFGAISGTLLIFMFFFIFAFDSGMFEADGVINWMTVAAYLGIISVGACMLMISGEFDLSIGSMIGLVGLAVAVPLNYWGWSASVSVLFAFAIALSIGYLNGYIVVKTGLPSFIVTLASLFILRGLTLAVSILLTNRTIISGVGEKMQADPVISFLFQGLLFRDFFLYLAKIGGIQSVADGTPLVEGIPKVILWWILLIVAGNFVLLKTKFGNWVFAAGGDAVAAKTIGVPVARVKIIMFMFTAFCAALFAVLQVSDIGSAAADRGLLKEFEAIITAVIGGTLLTGGYGSIVGAAFGTLIFGVVQIGIGYTDIDSNWFRVFVGFMLLVAVLFNNYIRQKVTQED